MPQLGKIMGTIWGSVKYPGLEDAKIQIMQPISANGDKVGRPIAVVDTIGAGPGECVLYITAYEAIIPYHRGNMVPIDASVIGIVDHIYLQEKEGSEKKESSS